MDRLDRLAERLSGKTANMSTQSDYVVVSCPHCGGKIRISSKKMHGEQAKSERKGWPTNSSGILVWPKGEQVGFLNKYKRYGDIGYYDQSVWGAVSVTDEQAENHNKRLLKQKRDELDRIGVGGRYDLCLWSFDVDKKDNEIMLTCWLPRNHNYYDDNLVSDKVVVMKENQKRKEPGALGGTVATAWYIITFMRGNKKFRAEIREGSSDNPVAFERIS